MQTSNDDFEKLEVEKSAETAPGTQFGTGHRMDVGTGPGIDIKKDARTEDGMSGQFSGRINTVTDNKTNPVTGHNISPVTHPGTDNRTHTTYISPKQRVSSPVWAISRQQAKILWYLIQAGGLTQREEIAINTGVPFGTVKNVLSGLHRDGFISKPKPYIDRAFRGFSYELNRHLCEEFMADRGETVFQEDGNDNRMHPGIRPVINPVTRPFNSPAYNPVTGHNTNPVTHPEIFPNSSSLESISTTRENQDLEHALKTDPDLEWWRQKGLAVKQIESWMETGNCSATNILQSLRHFAFEMVRARPRRENGKGPQQLFFHCNQEGWLL